MGDFNDIYYICFIDLMGQTKFFSGIQSAEVGPDIMMEVERVSDGLREMVRYAKNRYARNFSADDDVGVELFSDSILLSIKAVDGKYDNLAPWFDMIIKLVYIACRCKLPFRGGLTKGLAARSESGSIYGVGVDEAMRLEQNHADFFRIILSSNLAEELSNTEDVWRYLEIDLDSAVVLNYAGAYVLKRSEFSKEMSALFEIQKWVKDQFEYFRYTDDDLHNKCADSKLARRYKMWHDFLVLQALKMRIRCDV